ncbi:unnamed protein product [Microthlaspi erraticum]|uniref:GRPD C-terminal domain-containing protein n=1 Tax=Microthlaspi erraticum TaxID=1685480 RepID=A0A6D2K5Q2_9BRAS|nr:unnamed protein product [Microthlaspi erraticum]
MSLGSSEFADGLAARSLSEISEVDAVRIGADIVSAARRLIALLRSVGDSQWLHHPPVIAEAIRRYDELWMPLISDLTVNSKPTMILPPLDVEWVWFCHSLNPVSYRDYCLKRFSKLIGKPAIYDEENEDYAVLQCEKLWITRYPEESFENRADPDSLSSSNEEEEEDIVIITTEVEKQMFLWEKFSAPYMSETVYLIAARLRYKAFLLILNKFQEEISRLLPASDILLMWLTHQSYPTTYADDVDEMMEEITEKVVRNGENVDKSQVETTKKLWNRYFNQPYEKAGGELSGKNAAFYWPVSDIDVNTTAYKSVRPRFVLELCIFIRMNVNEAMDRSFLRLRVGRGHRKLQLEKKMTDLSLDASSSWQRVWHLYCEFGTQGVVLESHCDRSRGRGICFGSGKAEAVIAFPWNDLLRAHSLASGRLLGKQVSVFASVTPPVQAPYLLRFVPDRVTDDSGDMVSDSIQRTNNFSPQEGRWLTRTVLDHSGRECFVIRIRVGKGMFKRGGEVPSPVKSEERITEIRVGSWSYLEGSIGTAPPKVVGTVTPKEPVADWDAAWEFSTGDELRIRWDSSGSISELGLNSRTSGSLVKLLTGRRMQYKGDNEEEEEEDDGFVTMVRSTEEDPTEKATALIDWKHQAVEFLPEEDAVFVLLLSVSILRSVTQRRRQDVGKLLVRKRITEATGERDWGSVIVDASSSSSSCSPYVEPWYRNSGKVLAMEEKAEVARYPYPVRSYSNVDGGDNLYKHVIFG